MPVRFVTARLVPAVLLLAVTAAQAPAAPPGGEKPSQPAAASKDKKAKRPAKLVSRTYPVADLVVPVGNFTAPGTTGAAQQPCSEKMTTSVCVTATPPGDAKKTQEDRLIKLIVETVAPETWSERGGRGTVDYFPYSLSLVVNQTPAVHEQIEELLSALRRLQDVEVAFEVRLISVPEGFRERLGADFHPPTPKTTRQVDKDGLERIGVDFNADTAEKGAAPQPVFLNDIQVFQFLEAVQGDQRSNVMQTPKLTVLNGQAAEFQATDLQWFVTEVNVVEKAGQIVFVPRNEAVTTGVQMSVQPTVSADRRYVQVNFKMSQTSLDSPVPLFPVATPVTPTFEGGFKGQSASLTQFVQQPKVTTLAVDQNLVIPDGGTVLLGGWKQTREVARNEFGPPVLSKVPYVNRLFKNVGYSRETEHLLVMVTPRVIAHAEEEAPQALKAAEKKTARRAKPTGAGAMEESEGPADSPRLRKKDHDPSERSAHLPEGPVAELVEAYHQACADGRLDEARKFAALALALDPACFSRHR